MAMDLETRKRAVAEVIDVMARNGLDYAEGLQVMTVVIGSMFAQKDIPLAEGQTYVEEMIRRAYILARRRVVG